MFVARNVWHPNALDIINGRAKPDSIRDVPGASFEPARRWLIRGLLKRDVLNHVAAAMPGLRVFEHIELAVNDADARGPEHFVAGKNVKVTVKKLHVRADVRDGLRSVQKHFR